MPSPAGTGIVNRFSRLCATSSRHLKSPVCLSRVPNAEMITRFVLPVSLFPPYLGARIMVMNFPSNFGSVSIFATSASS